LDGSLCGKCPDCVADAANDAQWGDGGIPPFAPSPPAAHVQQFRKKPVVIEAMQYDGSEESQRAIVNWTNGKAEGWVDTEYHLVIRTLEGNHRANAGDWIIRGVQGEFYPCKPDIFEETYEPVT